MYMDEYWPSLELTKEELRFCRKYDGEYPVPDPDNPGKTIWKLFAGVKRRSYFNQLTDTTIPGEVSVAQDNFAPSGRRTRVFAFTFSGYVANWQVKIYSTSGELWVQDFTTITALCNSAPRVGSAMQTEILTGQNETVLLQQGVIPYRRDPNILLEGTQELVFEGRTITHATSTTQRYVLNIGVHVWEFPDMPRSDAQQRPMDGAYESMGSAMAVQ